MRDFINKILNSHDLILKGVLMLICVIIIVLALPKERKFKYEFQKGKPWLHENLYAPFDFAKMKSKADIEKERAYTIKNSPLYFTYSDSIRIYRIHQFQNSIKQLLDTSNSLNNQKHISNLEDWGSRLLESVYQKGIISKAQLEEQLSENSIIVVDKSGTYKETELADYFTINQAYEQIRQQVESSQLGKSEEWVDLIVQQIEHNVFFNEEKTEFVRREKLNNITLSFGKIEKSELIVAKGELVTESVFLELESLKREFEHKQGGNKNAIYILIGQIILVALVFLILTLFLSIFRQHIINVNNRVIFILISLTSVILMGIIPLYVEAFNTYLLPFCILPILIKTFYDEILASFIHIMAMIVIGFIAPNGFEFVYLEVTAGLIAVFSLVSLRKRSQLLFTVFIIFITYSIAYLALLLVQEGDLSNVRIDHFYSFVGSAVLTLLVYPLIYIFERIFGFLSDVTLMELSDTNSPLLRDLATKTPGTFQHSMQVANLAENAILSIGGNPLLVRTGALYHDIGKMEAPQFFIENQVSGINPHDELDAKESARIIINHVIRGIELAKKHKLPEILIDFIRTHHGTSMVKYFYHKQQTSYPDQTIDPKQYTYPGPIPFSKETAVLMMADACEAASRSLKNYSPDTINQLIDNIIDGQAKAGQFANADITFKDISSIKKIFKKMLLNIYHVRIEYPK